MSSFRELMEVVEVQKEHLVDELGVATEECEAGRMGEEDRRELIVRLLNQYEEFYAEKSGAAQRDVFQLFAPSWCCSLENAYLWLSGFRPTSLFSLVSASLPNLSQDQHFRLHRLKREIRMEEKALGEEQARIQETLASPPIINVMKQIGRSSQQPNPTPIKNADEAMQSVRAALQALVVNADTLRTKTATRVVEILDSGQSIKFLLAATCAQRNMKSQGIQRDVSLGVTPSPAGFAGTTSQ